MPAILSQPFLYILYMSQGPVLQQQQQQQEESEIHIERGTWKTAILHTK